MPCAMSVVSLLCFLPILFTQATSYTCVSGQTESGGPYLLETADNSQTACGTTCATTDGCVAFDFTTIVASNACRGVRAGQTPRTGEAGSDNRQYCTEAESNYKVVTVLQNVQRSGQSFQVEAEAQSACSANPTCEGYYRYQGKYWTAIPGHINEAEGKDGRDWLRAKPAKIRALASLASATTTPLSNYTVKHTGGVCTGNELDSESGIQTNVSACAALCDLVKECRFFAFCPPGTTTRGNCDEKPCLLYSTCPYESDDGGYTTYSKDDVGPSSEIVTACVQLAAALVFIFLGHVVLWPAKYELRMMYITLLGVTKSPPCFNRWAPPLQWLCILLLFLGPTLLAMAVNTALMDDFRIASLGGTLMLAIYSASFGFLRVKIDRYEWSFPAVILILFASFWLSVFFILFVYVVQPFTFVGTSILMLCVSAIPSTTLSFMMRPWRSTGALLAILQGEEPKRPFVQRNLRVLAPVFMCLSVSVLMTYGGLVYVLHPDESVKYVGFVVAIAVLILDGMIWHLWYLGLVDNALHEAGLIICARVAACVWGENFWLIGHTGVFIAAGVIMAHVTVDYRLPRPNSLQRLREELAGRLIDSLDAKLAAASGTLVEPSTKAGESTTGDGSKAGKCSLLDPLWLFIVLVCSFAAEVAVTTQTSALRKVDWICSACPEREQQYYSAIALIFILLYTLTIVLVRQAQWKVKKEKEPLLLIAWKTLVPTYICWIGLAGFVSYVFDSYIIIVNAGFLPFILLAFHEAYVKWVADDFVMKGASVKSSAVIPSAGDATVATEDDAPTEGNSCTQWVRSIPLVARVWGLDLLLVLMYATIFHMMVTPDFRWVGWTVASGLVLLGLTFLGNRAWFGTFKFDKWQWLAGLIGILILIVWAGGVWTLHRKSKVDYFALTLVLVVILYPACYFAIFATQILRDAQWHVKDRTQKLIVKCAFSISGSLGVAFLGVLAILGFIAEMICLLALLALVVAIGIVVWMWWRNGRYLPAKTKQIISAIFILLVILPAIGMAAYEKNIFIGFCVICAGAVFLLSCWGISLVLEVRSLPRVRQLWVSSDLFFPAFRPDDSGDIMRADDNVLTLLAVLAVITIWGFTASAVVSSMPYPGVVCAALALTGSFVLLCQLVSAAGTTRLAIDKLNPTVIEAAVEAALGKETKSIASGLAADVAEDFDEECGGYTEYGLAIDSAVPDAEIVVTVHPLPTVNDELLAAEEKVAEARGEEMAAGGPMSSEMQTKLRDKLSGFTESRKIAFKAYRDALHEANRGKFHPIPVVSLYFLLFGGRKHCLPDTTPTDAHVTHTDLKQRAQELNDVKRQQQRFVARVLLNLLTAEAQRRWAEETRFARFLSSLGASLGDFKLSLKDYEHLPKPQRQKLEQAWILWKAGEDTAAQDEEDKRQQEIEADRKRKEKLRKVRADARAALDAATNSGDIDALIAALSQASEAGLYDSDPEVKFAKQAMEKLQKAREALNTVVSSITTSATQLLQELLRAKAAGLTGEPITLAEAKLEELEAAEADHEATKEDEARKRKEKEELRKRMEEERKRKQKEEEKRRQEEWERRMQEIEEARKKGKRRIIAIDGKALANDVPAGSKFVDNDFTRRKAMNAECAPSMKKAFEDMQWARLSDKKKDLKLEVGGFTPEDLGQGELGNCWFISAMACCASKPDIIKNLFTYHDEEKGLYVVRLYSGGVFRDFAVDDYVPMRYDKPSLCRSNTDSNEVWPSILEKAYAKCYGSYCSLEGGHVSDGCVDLTGGLGSAMPVKDDSGSLWAKICGFVTDGHLLGAGSPSGRDTAESAKANKGIVQGHAYSVLKATEIDGHRLMQIRNPWGDTEWTGKWSDKDKKSWTQRMKAKLDYADKDDGSFWMAYEDFLTSFSNLYICRILGEDWKSSIVASEWKGKTAGGCSNYPTFKDNSVFRLKISSKTRILLILEQATHGAKRKKFAINMAVSKPSQWRGGKYCSTFFESGTYAYKREVCCEKELTPDSGGDYYIRATTFDPKEETKFWIKVYWKEDADVSVYEDK